MAARLRFRGRPVAAIPAPASRGMQCVADGTFIYWTSGDNVMAIEK
jgi:hypothetical protein